MENVARGRGLRRLRPKSGTGNGSRRRAGAIPFLLIAVRRDGGRS